MYNLISGCQDGGGFIVSYNDIAGVYSGIVFSIANTLGSIPGFLAPYSVGILRNSNKKCILNFFYCVIQLNILIL